MCPLILRCALARSHPFHSSLPCLRSCLPCPFYPPYICLAQLSRSGLPSLSQPPLPSFSTRSLQPLTPSCLISTSLLKLALLLPFGHLLAPRTPQPVTGSLAFLCHLLSHCPPASSPLLLGSAFFFPPLITLALAAPTPCLHITPPTSSPAVFSRIYVESDMIE